MLVTMLVILFGMAVYAGMGYLVIEGNNKLKTKLWTLLWEKEVELETKRICGFWLADEYVKKTTIDIRNEVLTRAMIIVFLLLWPISEAVTSLWMIYVYRRLMGEVKRF